MLAYSSGTMGVGVIKSTIKEYMAGMIYFAGDAFEKRIVNEYYSGVLTYSNLFGDRDSARR